jgi:hypothetical protein
MHRNVATPMASGHGPSIPSETAKAGMRTIVVPMSALRPGSVGPALGSAFLPAGVSGQTH